MWVWWKFSPWSNEAVSSFSSTDFPYLLFGMPTKFHSSLHLTYIFFWNRDLKSTEFLKSTPETSNQKFDQYWPTVWRGVVGIDAHGIIAYTLSSQSSESREDNECDISNRILLRTARGFIQQELQICLAVLMLHLLDNKNSKQLSGRKEICICQKTLLFTGSSASLCFLMCCLKQKKKLFKSEGHARYHLPLLQPPWSNSDNRTHPYKLKWD